MKQKKSSKLWKKLIIICMGILLVCGGALGYILTDLKKQQYNPTTWQAYSATDDRFQVQFPADPKEDSKEMEIADKTLQYQELKAEANEAQYTVSYIDFPGIWKMIGTSKLLTKAFDGMLQQEQNVEELVKQELSDHKGYPSLNYHFKQDGKDVHGRLVIAGNTLYRITVTFPQTIAEKVQHQDFLESFELKT